MERITIICVDDQKEVLSTVEKDLEMFDDYFTVESCDSANEALALLATISASGDYVAIIISDHVMPEKKGIDFLIDVHQDARFKATKKLLLTGLASQSDTIEAINKAAINHYFEKPWEPELLQETVKRFITEYILENGIDYKPYMPILHSPTFLDYMISNGVVLDQMELLN